MKSKLPSTAPKMRFPGNSRNRLGPVPLLIAGMVWLPISGYSAFVVEASFVPGDPGWRAGGIQVVAPYYEQDEQIGRYYWGYHVVDARVSFEGLQDSGLQTPNQNTYNSLVNLMNSGTTRDYADPVVIRCGTPVTYMTMFGYPLEGKSIWPSDYSVAVYSQGHLIARGQVPLSSLGTFRIHDPAFPSGHPPFPSFDEVRITGANGGELRVGTQQITADFVPEPSTAILGLVSSLGAMLRRRRK